MEKGSTNILKPILSFLGDPATQDKYNTMDECKAHLNKLFVALEMDEDLSKKKSSSIGASMLKVIIHEMKLKKGVLIWGPLLNPSASYYSRGAAERVYEAEHIHAERTANTAKNGQYVFIDAERVGWSGEPAVFQELAVHGNHVMNRARAMMKSTHHVGQHSTHVLHKALTGKQVKAINDWSGNVMFDQIFPDAY